MKIHIICPAGAGARAGNRITARRWATLLRGLGHRVAISSAWDGRRCDLLIALHAWRSLDSVQAFRRRFPAGALVVALTGTDLYRDLKAHPMAQRALEAASRLVVLHPLGAEALKPALRSKARPILQSARAIRSRPAGGRGPFTVSVVGHLRPVKDPFRAALAVRALPRGSRTRVVQAGAALSPAIARRAEREMARNDRYRWLGDRPRGQARRLIARSRVMVLSSRMEGGANVISEAVTAGTPVLASRIHSSVGLLGADYPGYFPVGDTRALRALLRRCEEEPAFLAGLRRRIARLAPRFAPARERVAWAALLAELFPPA